MAEPDVAALLAGARAGRVRDLARLLTLVEDDALPASSSSTLAPAAGVGRTAVIGITGSPGVGKSTTTSALVGALRAAGRRVAVLAIDPSSPFTGGAVLGDRVRMAEHSTDPGVFIRSMAARGHLGGLAATTPKAIAVLAAVGFDVVIVETVGVGQSEVEVATAADTTVVVLAPGAGDAVQAAKAGVLEIADVLVVNKADLAGADATVRQVRNAVAMRPDSVWSPPVVRMSASTGAGVADLVEAIDQHRRFQEESGALVRRRHRRVVDEIRAEAVGLVLSRSSLASVEHLADEVAAGRLGARAAAARLVHEVCAADPSTWSARDSASPPGSRIGEERGDVVR